MQIVSNGDGDNLHELSTPVFWENKKKSNLSTAELTMRVCYKSGVTAVQKLRVLAYQSDETNVCFTWYHYIDTLTVQARANSVDPDQTSHSTVSDLDLHCLYGLFKLKDHQGK